jgi:outer membrane protein OmpA-like peptidoglycan-associated protein
LIAIEGMDARRLEVKSLGESMPLADNGNAQGRQLNRRVVLKVFYPK